MPTYDYECPQCGRFDIVQRISAAALEVCPECGSPVQRLISKNVAIIFKGSGFYATDNKTKNKDFARKLNKERQSESQAIADGDIGSFIAESDKTNKKIVEGL